jgi:hypothetical protein
VNDRLPRLRACLDADVPLSMASQRWLVAELTRSRAFEQSLVATDTLELKARIRYLTRVLAQERAATEYWREKAGKTGADP